MTTKASRQTNTPAADCTDPGADPGAASGALPSTAALEVAWEAEICVRQLRALLAPAGSARLSKRQQIVLQECEDKARLLQECRPAVTVRPLGVMPLVAGTWDFLDLTARIDALLGPKQNATWSYGAVCRALALHLAETDMGCLGHSKSVQQGSRILAGQGACAEIALPDTQAVADLLDAIAALGDTGFFNTLSAGIWQRLGRQVTTVSWTDNAALLPDEGSNADGEVGLVVDRQQDSQDPADGFRLIGLCDRDTWLPVFVHDIDRIPPGQRTAVDATRLTSLLERDARRLQEIFPSIRRLVPDQSLCTPRVVQCCRKAGLHVAGKLAATRVRDFLADHPDMVRGPFHVLRSLCTLSGEKVIGIGARWCHDLRRVGRHPVCALLVEDKRLEFRLRDQSQEAARRKVDEVAHVLACTFPTRDEALAALWSRPVRNDLCALENAVIKEVRDARFGTGFRIVAGLAINKPALDAFVAQVRSDAYSILVSTDREYEWLMDELWMHTRTPGAANSVWVPFARQAVWMHGTYVNTQARSRALLCLFHLLALVFGSTALLAGEALERLGLSVEALDPETSPKRRSSRARADRTLQRPLLQRLLEVVRKSNMAVFWQGEQVVHVKADPKIRDLLAAMGKPWYACVDPTTCQPRELPEGEV